MQTPNITIDGEIINDNDATTLSGEIIEKNQDAGLTSAFLLNLLVWL